MNFRSNPSNRTANRSMPPGTIIPELIYNDMSAAVSWLCKAFGFKERLRIGSHRTQLTFGDASVIAVAGRNENAGRRDNAAHSVEGSALQQPSGELTHSIMVRVEDVERHYEHARIAGARIISPPTDYPFGERQYTAEDIGSHIWTFSQSVADIDPGEWGGEIIAGAEDSG